MIIGGAEFVMGISREPENTGTPTMALKLVIYGMDGLETAQTVFERLSATLLDMDPQLELAEIKGDKYSVN